VNVPYTGSLHSKYRVSCPLPLLSSYQRITIAQFVPKDQSNSEAPVFVYTMIRFYGGELLTSHPIPCWRATSCLMSAASYSIHLQLPRILEAVLNQQPEIAPCRDDRDPIITVRICTEETKIFPSNTVVRNGHCQIEILSLISTMLVFSNFVFCRFFSKVSRHRCITNEFNVVYNCLS
jgi:hypothetical protein